MDHFGWIQLTLFVGILLVLTKPMGVYLTKVLDVEGKTFLDLAIGPVERFFYCLLYTSQSPRDRTRSRMPSSA